MPACDRDRHARGHPPVPVRAENRVRHRCRRGHDRIRRPPALSEPVARIGRRALHTQLSREADSGAVPHSGPRSAGIACLCDAAAHAGHRRRAGRRFQGPACESA